MYCFNYGRILWCIIRYGAQMRAWVDIVGYSSVKTNGIDDDDEFVLSPLEHSSRGV